MVISRLGSLCVVVAVTLLLLAGRAPLAEAQITIQCTTDCVTYSVLVTGGGSASHPTNTGPHSVSFQVWNTGNVVDTYTLTCSRTGGISCGTVTPSSVTLSPSPVQPIASPGLEPNGAPAVAPMASNALVTVSYSVGTSSGSVTFTARGTGPGAPSSSASLTVTAVAPPGPPQVVLRNFNGDNLDRSLCLTAGAGEGGASVCGDLLVSHALPSYTTMGRERSLTLVYNSGSARPQPVLLPAITQGGSTLIPSNVLVELSVGGVVRKTVIFPGSGWGTSALATRQVSIPYDAVAAGHATGAYPFSLRVQNQYAGSTFDASPITGTLLIVNRGAGAFGAGVWLAGVEQLVFNQPAGASNGSILWVGGDGSAKLYSPLTTTSWRAPPGSFRDTLRLAAGQYVRTLRHGVKVTFDAQGRHIKTTNRAGHVTTFFWNATTNRLDSIGVPPAGQAATKYKLGYAASSLDYIDDPAGRRLDATVAANGTLQTIVDPDARSTTFGYDGATKLMTSRTNRRGHTTLYEYANSLRLTKVTIPVGRSASDAATAVTQFRPWDEKGISIPTDTALAYTTILGPRFPAVSDTAAIWVDRFGAPSKIVNPLGFTTRIERSDALVPAQVTSITYPNQRVLRMTYNGRGNLTQVRDSTSHLGASGLPTSATTYTYGTGAAQDSPTRVVDSTDVPTSPIVTNYAYNALGLTQQVTAPNGHVTKFAYSSLNLVKAVTELAVPVWNQASATEPLDSLHTGFAFNALGNVTSDTSPMGRVRRYTRDAVQRVSDGFDPANHRVQYTYDVLNRPVDVTEHVSPTPLLTHTAYDIDVMASVTDPRGVIRSWQYDKAGRQIGETDDWNNTELRFYSPAGQIDSIRPRVFALNGSMIHRRYDAAGQEVKKVWTSRYTDTNVVGARTDSVLYSYDNMGSMLTATTSRQKVARTYFASGELSSEVQSRADGSVPHTHTYSYDKARRRTSYVLGPVGSASRSDILTYTYKPTGELNSIRMRWRGALAAADSAVFIWDALGRRDSVRYSNGAFIKFAYDRDGALRLVCGNDLQGSPAHTDVSQFTYNNAVVDGEGLITSIATVLPGTAHGCKGNSTLSYTQTNSYDARHQLLTMARDGNVHTYGYDGSGNMIRDYQSLTGATDNDFFVLPGHNRLETRTPSAGNQIIIQYDANQARSQECPAGSICAPLFPGDPATAQFRRYFYDGLGRLAGTAEFVPIAQQVFAPEYDPVGRFLQAPDSPVRFGFDGENIVRTNYDSAAASWTLVHGPGLDDPVIGHFQVLSGAGEIISQKTVYFATDGQGHQYGVGDAQGRNMSGDVDYAERGGRYAGGTLNAASFAADRNSAGTMRQLSFFRNRFYDQQSGRWTQEDPIGVAGGLNLYQFNGNNPVTFSDPFGLCPPKESCERIRLAVEGGDSNTDPGLADPVMALATILTGGGALGARSLAAGIGESGAGKVVIGETMSRVRSVATKLGAEVFETTAGTAKEIWKANSTWLRGAMREGKEIVDIGKDASRAARSKFYQAEKELIDRRMYPTTKGNE